ncbi:MAG: TetR/AcrR family transcriptional regulator [Bacteroidales bacterium]|nr:TetR/AcrR family transcriptional regulator [Bacteroidales bacterium]
MEKKTELEEQILRVAEEQLLTKGYDGTSLSEVARQIGCNQALLHYYYRTKENLLKQIFVNKFQTMLSVFDQVNDADKNFLSWLETTVGNYYDLLASNPPLPLFVLNELVRNEDRRAFIKNSVMNDERLVNIYMSYAKALEKAIDEGVIRPIKPVDLILTVVSMVAFVFMSKPVYCDFLEVKDEERDNYIARKKTEVIDILINGIKA